MRTQWKYQVPKTQFPHLLNSHPNILRRCRKDNSCAIKTESCEKKKSKCAEWWNVRSFPRNAAFIRWLEVNEGPSRTQSVRGVDSKRFSSHRHHSAKISYNISFRPGRKLHSFCHCSSIF